MCISIYWSYANGRVANMVRNRGFSVLIYLIIPSVDPSILYNMPNGLELCVLCRLIFRIWMRVSIGVRVMKRDCLKEMSAVCCTKYAANFAFE